MTITIAYVNFWNDSLNDKYLSNFIKKNIDNDVKHVNINEYPDILISSCFGDINRVKNIPAKYKFFFYGENLQRSCYNSYNNFDILREIFDLIIGFNPTDIKKKQIRIPLWLINYDYYMFDFNDNILTYIQNKYNENIKNKNMLATLVCRHDRNNTRTQIANNLEKYGKVYYGGTFKNNVGNIGPSPENKRNFISNSILNVCPENSKAEGYCTEKIFQAFEGGTIPLYWGVGLPEPNIINENKYCFCNIENKEILEKQIYDVVNNKEKYINGAIFKDTAHIQLKKYYDDLKSAIMTLNFTH
tara:strand:+ start:819 stop:1721 length:903 start_codon:yes stop_codon:yes gene_type:complete